MADRKITDLGVAENTDLLNNPDTVLPIVNPNRANNIDKNRKATFANIASAMVDQGLVEGPATSTSGRVAVFNSADGTLLRDGVKAEVDLVVGPASSTGDTVALFDGTTGTVLKSGGKLNANLVEGPASAVTDNRMVVFDQTSGRLVKQAAFGESDVVTLTGTQTLTNKTLTSPNGTAAAPSFSFASPNTGNGMYLADTNTLAFSTDGAERLRITSAGEVSVASRLTVLRTGADAELKAETTANPNIAFLRLQTGGGVFLIGTIPGAGGQGIAFTQSGIGERMRITSTGAIQLPSGSPGITTAGNGNLVLAPGGTGNVGIGTTSPTDLLHVNGDANITLRLAPGKNYPQTDGSTATSIVDTGIGPTFGMIFEVFVTGNRVLSGSAAYRQASGYYVYVQTGFAGGDFRTTITTHTIFETALPGSFPGVMSFTATFWDGSTESANINGLAFAGKQIRFKFGPYTNNTGANQQIRVRQII